MSDFDFYRFHFMVNGEDLVDHEKPTMKNKFGNESNYITIPLLAVEKSVDLTTFLYQDESGKLGIPTL